MAFTVGELAKLTGVTVRTLHHYDEIGLVTPSQRTAAGYRLYGERDVLRLQQVLVHRELGLPLEQIAAVLDAPGFARVDALQAQRAALVQRRGKLDAMLAAVDAALRLEEGKADMKADDVKQLFCSLRLTGLPLMRTWSVGMMRWPMCAGSPFTDTRPAMISSSISRREPMPASASTLCSFGASSSGLSTRFCCCTRPRRSIGARTPAPAPLSASKAGDVTYRNRSS